MLRLLLAVIEKGGIGLLHLTDRSDLARHTDKGHFFAALLLSFTQSQVVGAIGVPGSCRIEDFLTAGNQRRNRMRRQLGIARGNSSAIDHAFFKHIGEHRGDDTAILSGLQNPLVRGARDQNSTIVPEDPLVDRRLIAKDLGS
jgi:hypothetical protein